MTHEASSDRSKRSEQTLEELVQTLRHARGLTLKREIAQVAQLLAESTPATWSDDAESPIRNGDDAAAIPDGDGYMLVAAEGMLADFVATDPWFAGFCAVMVNVSDILAMGGRPYAVVDVLFSGDEAQRTLVLRGLRDGARAFGVPVVGGHTSPAPGGATLLAAAIVGRARRLITSFAARPGDDLIIAIDLRGRYRAHGDYFDAATCAERIDLHASLALLPRLAEAGLVRAGKDISMAGIAGTLVMLCEGSGVGATLALERVPRPANAPLARWLCTFPSYGFLLAVEPRHSARVHAQFAAIGVASVSAGAFDESDCVALSLAGVHRAFWDVRREPLTGFGAHAGGGER